MQVSDPTEYIPGPSATHLKRETAMEKAVSEIRYCLLQKYVRAVRRPANNLNYVRMTQSCLEDTYLSMKRVPEVLRHLLLGTVLAVNIRKMTLVQALDRHLSAIAVNYCIPHIPLRPASEQARYLSEKHSVTQTGCVILLANEFDTNVWANKA